MGLDRILSRLNHSPVRINAGRPLRQTRHRIRLIQCAQQAILDAGTDK